MSHHIGNQLDNKDVNLAKMKFSLKEEAKNQKLLLKAGVRKEAQGLLIPESIDFYLSNFYIY